MASECPLKILTQSPERLSQILTFPSTQPAAMYLEAPSHDKHVTPSCSQGYKNMRLWWETDRQFNFWKVFYYYFFYMKLYSDRPRCHMCSAEMNAADPRKWAYCPCCLLRPMEDCHVKRVMIMFTWIIKKKT